MSDGEQRPAIMIESGSAGGFAVSQRESFQNGGRHVLYACCSTAEETAALILKMLSAPTELKRSN